MAMGATLEHPSEQPIFNSDIGVQAYGILYGGLVHFSTWFLLLLGCIGPMG